LERHFQTNNWEREFIRRRIFVGKPEGKRLLGSPRRRWVDIVRMDLKRDSMGWYEMD
jgi:hypothetical protein